MAESAELLKMLFSSNSGEIKILLQSGETIKIHKCILESASDVLAAHMNNGMLETNKDEINMSQYRDKITIMILKSLYLINDIFNDLSMEELFEAMVFCDFYNFQNTFKKIEYYLIQKIDEKNAMQLLNLCEQNSSISAKIQKELEFMVCRMFDHLIKEKAMINPNGQFKDYCFDLIRPGEGIRNSEYKYYLCCKHAHIPKEYLAFGNGNLQHHGKSCCINNRGTTQELKAQDYTQFCCLHRSQIAFEVKDHLNNRKEMLQEKEQTFLKSLGIAPTQFLKRLIQHQLDPR